MSNLVPFENLKQLVNKQQANFEELARIHGAVHFKKEAAFAIQILENGDYLRGIAEKNQDSLRNAVINVAAIGLTLSPVLKLAYLVPRDGKVCLDISYQGLIQLGIDCGAIIWCVADVVRENDDFVLHGLGKEPEHKYKPFAKDRGEIVGGYCTAKTPAGDFITIVMDIELIYKIRGRSEAFKKNSGPWKTDEIEMIKKTLIKRGYKSWPKTGKEENKERMAQAMSLEEEAIETTATPVIENESRATDIKFLQDGLKTLGRTEDAYIKHLATMNRREIKKLDDLLDSEVAAAKIQMNQWLENSKKSTTATSPKDVTTPKADSKPDDKKAAESELDSKLGINKEKDVTPPVDFLQQKSGEIVCEFGEFKGEMIKDIKTEQLEELLGKLETDSKMVKLSETEVLFYNNGCTYSKRPRNLTERKK